MPVAKALNIPALPITPFFPFAGILGVLPLPSPVDVHIGKPIDVNANLSSNYSDEDIDSEVEQIKSTVEELLSQGLKTRRPFWPIKLLNHLVIVLRIKMLKSESVLIIGISGGLAQITAKVLQRENPNLKIVGVDNRSVTDLPKLKGVIYKKIRYSRNEFERLFRAFKFDYVYHLARMTHAKSNPKATLAQRLDLNVMGTNRILEQSLEYGVKKLVMLSTWHVYGAFPDNPIFIKENSLLKASIKNPDLRDVVEMDQLTTNFLWKNQAN